MRVTGVTQTDGSLLTSMSNAFVYTLNGDPKPQLWTNAAAIGKVSLVAPKVGPKLYNDALADRGGLLLRANKNEGVIWHKASGSQSNPYWRMSSDVFLGSTQLLHFADSGAESTSHWFLAVNSETGSLEMRFGTRDAYLLGSSFDQPTLL
jgi:hypothetical protein